MSTCYSCTKNFSLFNPEKSCGQCRLSFCKSCLPGTMYLERLGQDGKVCSKCLKTLSRKSSERERSPPSALMRRLEMMKTPPPSTTIIYKDSPANSKMAKLKRDLSLEDQKIVSRLEKLHQDRVELTKKAPPPPPREEEIAARLAKLKGEATHDSVMEAHPHHVQPDNRTSIQKQEDMIKEAQDKIRLEAMAPDPDKEIASRLAKLKGESEHSKSPLHGTKKDEAFESIMKTYEGDMECESMSDIEQIMKKLEQDARDGLKELGEDKEVSKKMQEMNINPSSHTQMKEEDDENESRQVLQQILDEAAIEEKLGQMDSLPAFEDNPIKVMNQYSEREIRKQLKEDEEEFPWCIICNGDATVRCFDCESDLYCNRCFRECHDEFDDESHKTTKFVPKQK